MSRRRAILVGLIGPLLFGCAGASTAAVRTARAPRLLRWKTFEHMLSPLSLAMGRSDGLPVLAANGKLYLLHPSGRRVLFAPGYQSNASDEAEIAVPAANHRGCSFGANNVYALRPTQRQGITRVTAHGRVTQFASINVPGLIDGIAFDGVGLFRHRLLVTSAHGTTSTVVAINCHGTVTTITTNAPRIEGGMLVAPVGFGRFAGDLVAAGELDGDVWAITPTGKSLLVAKSGLPHPGYWGVGSEAFVPNNPDAVLLAADRGVPGSAYPGDNELLELSVAALGARGVRAGDLVVATEGGAFTDAIRCDASRCSVRYVAKGPADSHIDGNIGYVVR